MRHSREWMKLYIYVITNRKLNIILLINTCVTPIKSWGIICDSSVLFYNYWWLYLWSRWQSYVSVRTRSKGSIFCEPTTYDLFTRRALKHKYFTVIRLLLSWFSTITLHAYSRERENSITTLKLTIVNCTVFLISAASCSVYIDILHSCECWMLYVCIVRCWYFE